MKWYSSIATSPSLAESIEKISLDLKSQFGDAGCDLAFLFISWGHRHQIVDSWTSLRREIPAKTVIGCTAGGVIGGGKEIEDQLAVSVVAAKLPNVTITPFHTHQERLPGSDGSPRPWRDLIHADVDKNPHFIILSDPFSLDPDSLVSGLDFAYPKSIKVGGLASGGSAPDENILIYNDKALHKGAIGVTLSGDIDIEPVVAQGCKPIGEPLRITEADGNILVSINNERPVKYLTSLFEKLSPADRELLKTSLFIGLLMDPLDENPGRGHFLIRNILGLDMEEGIMAVGAPLRVGQTIQFHLRDAQTSKDDLKTMLMNSKSSKAKGGASFDPTATGAVLFSCLGRGEHLYGVPHHDTTMFKSVVGDIPVGGFFCNGEIGPVSGKTYIHGYTSSFAVFRPTKKSATAEALLHPSRKKTT